MKSLQFSKENNDNLDINLKSNAKANEIKLLDEELNLIVSNSTNYTGEITGFGNVTFKGNNKLTLRKNSKLWRNVIRI